MPELRECGARALDIAKMTPQRKYEAFRERRRSLGICYILVLSSLILSRIYDGTISLLSCRFNCSLSFFNQLNYLFLHIKMLPERDVDIKYELSDFLIVKKMILMMFV